MTKIIISAINNCQLTHVEHFGDSLLTMAEGVGDFASINGVGDTFIP